MRPILQRFEFSYADGEQFWDRSGQLAFALRKLMPGLRVTGSAAEQRDFVDETTKRDLVFGISLAAISSAVEGDDKFIPAAAAFFQELVLHFEVQWLRGFAFRYALGRRCSSADEAEALFFKMLGKGEQERLKVLGPTGQVHAVQTEYRRGQIEVIARFAVVERASDLTDPSEAYPYFVVLQEARGTEPIAVGRFDAEAFMTRIAEQQMNQIVGQIESTDDE